MTIDQYLFMRQISTILYGSMQFHLLFPMVETAAFYLIFITDNPKMARPPPFFGMLNSSECLSFP